MTAFMATGTTFILPSDLQPMTCFRAIEKYKVCQTLFIVSIREEACDNLEEWAGWLFEKHYSTPQMKKN